MVVLVPGLEERWIIGAELVRRTVVGLGSGQVGIGPGGVRVAGVGGLV